MNISFAHEPAAWLGLIRAVVVASSAFGFQLTAEQTTGIYLVVEAVTSLVQRTAVTPNSKL